VETCSHCGADLPENATFCPSCGRRTDLPPSDAHEEPIDVQHAQPRFFGLGSPVFVFGVMLVLLVAGIVLIVMDALVVGVISIVFAACLLPTFLAGARRWPETRLARVSVGTADRVRDEADVAVESISTWSKASRDVIRLRKEQFQLRRERDARIRELGVSVFAEDGRADDLKASAQELDERRLRNEREQQRAIASARRRTRKRHAAVVATEVIEPEQEQTEVTEEQAQKS
jgi:zinc-ribbon domain